MGVSRGKERVGMRIAVIADVHIASDLAWTQRVWEAFLASVEREGISYVVVGGDLFDSLDDALRLRTWLEESLQKTPSIQKVLWVVGNHDLTNPQTGKQKTRLSDMRFGEKVEVCLEPDLYILEEGEILVYPFPSGEKEGFSPSVLSSRFPSPEKPRIAVGHATLSSWIPNVEEADNGVIPKNFAAMFQCDRVFLGHIHARLQDGVYSTIGSARVWRRKEYGDHGYLVYDTEHQAEQFVRLPEGRTYQEIDAFVFYDTVEFPQGVDVTEHTWLGVNVYGVVHSDDQKKAMYQRIQDAYRGIAEISFDETSLFLASALEKHPIWQIFFEKWREGYEQSDDRDKPIWLLAREIFVREFCTSGGGGTWSKD